MNRAIIIIEFDLYSRRWADGRAGKDGRELFSRALLEIGQRMIQLKLAPAATDIFQRRPQVFSLKITFTSVPPLQVICQGERRLFYRIAEKMKRSLPSEMRRQWNM